MRLSKSVIVVLAVSLLVGSVPPAEAGDYGFGRVVKLGLHDRLLANENLLVYTADTVAFKFILKSPRKETLGKTNLEDPSHFRISCNRTPIRDFKVIGHLVRIHHMGHAPKAYQPHYYRVQVYVKLPAPMREGELYTFTAAGIGPEKVSASVKWSDRNVLSEAIKVNQIGYVPNSRIRLAYFGKWLGAAGALDKAITSFSLIDLQTGKKVFTGSASVRHKAGQKNEGAYKSDFSGENVYGLDFAEFSRPGAYCVSIPGVGRSYSFRIGADVMSEPLFTSIRALFHERCGIELKKSHTPWTRRRCKNHVRIAAYPEYGPMPGFKEIGEYIRKGKANGTIKYNIVKGGYHDAADYDRRPMHIRIAQMLCSVYDMNPKAFIDRQFMIPESGNGIPDILDEAYFGLSYYLDTQWPDGGVSAGSEAWEHPKNKTSNAWMTNTDNEITEYLQLPVSQLACFDFAASAAHLGRLLKKFPDSRARGGKLIAAAVKAFDCGMKKFPPRKLNQEILVAQAAAQLMHSTGDPRFAKVFGSLGLKGSKIDYLNNMLFAYAFCSVPSDTPGLDRAFQKKVRTDAGRTMTWAVNAFTKKKGYLHYKNPWAPIVMGSHSTGQAWTLALAWKVTGDRGFHDLLSASADVCLGANPMGQVQCSGLGQKHILHPEFLESMNDKLVDSLPGLWVYGPGRGTHWIWKNTVNSPGPKQIPALYRYIDIDQCPAQTEFTVTESLAPAVVIFGALARENPKPYKGPLPKAN
ncbi:MAG: glycoside hydrolase family 9 protein [Phycisphaerae bacterium]|jgi:endoglucanase|nr:glycoside hydrolase family 9 protein [Phycisphaerae bacterium]